MQNPSFKVKYVFFYQIKVGTSVIPQFDVISTGKSIYGTIFYDARSSSRSKTQFKGQK